MLGKILAEASAKQKRDRRSQRPGFLSSLGHELRDYCVHGDRIDWVSVLLPTSIGTLSGVLISFTLTDGGEYLVRQNPFLWVVVALGCGLGVSAAFIVAITAGLGLVIGVELLLDARRPCKERRRMLRENIRHLRGSFVDGRIPLVDLENIRTTLRVRDGSAEQSGVGWYERILVQRWRRQRERVEGLLEISWQDALPEALLYLAALNKTKRRYMPDTADFTDTTEVAWYLAHNPTNVAVQRLLSEYLQVERKNGNGYLDFRTGVVYTPRWVYELVHRAENFSLSRADFSGRRGPKSRDIIGNECEPIGDVDRETVATLYEPHGDGPLGSLREAVETARRI